MGNAGGSELVKGFCYSGGWLVGRLVELVASGEASEEEHSVRCFSVNGHFSERNFGEKNFGEKNFREKNFSDHLVRGTSVSIVFAEWN